MIQKKICMVGASAVGKTSLVRRFVESIFDERYHTTIGVKIDKAQIEANGCEVKLVIWDLAGEDELAQVRISHLRGASGYLLVIDGGRESTLAIARDLQCRVSEALGPLPFLLLVNKSDLADEWDANPNLAEVLTLGWQVHRTSAKTGEGVEAAFRELAVRMLETTA